MRHQHAAGDNIDDGEALFLTAMHLKGEACSVRGDGEMMRVPSFEGLREFSTKHRDGLAADGGKDGGRMQDLGAEVGQLRGFLKADHLDAQCIGDRCAGPWS